MARHENLKELLAKDQHRRAAVLRQFSLATGLVLLPFTIANLNTDPVMGTANLIVVLAFFATAYVRWRGRVPAWDGAEVLILAALVVCASIVHQQRIGIYWSYVLVPAFHFVLRRKPAIIINCLYLILVAACAYIVVGTGETLRVFFTHLLSGWISLVFAAKVAKQQAILSDLAIIDPLTQTYNRRHLDELMQDAAEQANRYQVPFSVIVFDLDHFKKVNDELGHETGDQVLSALCELVMNRVRKTDAVFRYGGEEFVILVRHTKADVAFEVANDLIAIVAQAPLLRDRTITMSCGVSEYRAGEEPSELIRRADEALYEAKRLGRNRAHLAARDRRAALPIS